MKKIFIICIVVFLFSCDEIFENLRSDEKVKIFQAWTDMDHDDSDLNNLAKHDLIFTGIWFFETGFKISKEEPYEMLSYELYDIKEGKKKRDKLLSLNPDMKILCELYYREAYFTEDENVDLHERSHLPLDSEFWIRQESGIVAPAWGEDDNADGQVDLSEIRTGLVDFTNKSFQELFIKRIRAIEESKLFDGIMLDWWSESSATSGYFDWSDTYFTLEEEVEARINLLKKIREVVAEDFLILVNSNDNIIPLSKDYVNGLYMECYKENYKESYSFENIKKIEDTLTWAEENLRIPRINCLEGWRVVDNLNEDLENRIIGRNSDENLMTMRLFTTMSLTLSDGYVLFSDDNALPNDDHGHNYYDFWDKKIGKAISEKNTLLEDYNDVYIREYENAVVIYNGSLLNISLDLKNNVFDKLNIESEINIKSLDGNIYMKEGN